MAGTAAPSRLSARGVLSRTPVSSLLCIINQANRPPPELLCTSFAEASSIQPFIVHGGRTAIAVLFHGHDFSTDLSPLSPPATGKRSDTLAKNGSREMMSFHFLQCRKSASLDFASQSFLCPLCCFYFWQFAVS
jgi:hypothetical protein